MPGIEIGGVWIPSVTEILEQVGLAQDFSSVPPAVLEHARLRGRALHKAIAWHALGILDEGSIHPEIEPGFRAYQRFLAEAKHEPLWSEKELRHPTWKFCGHPDRVGWINGNTRVLIDFKYQDSTDLRAGTYQLSGYELLCQANFPTEPIEKLMLLELHKDSTYRLHTVKADHQTFLAALLVYRAKGPKANV